MKLLSRSMPLSLFIFFFFHLQGARGEPGETGLTGLNGEPVSHMTIWAGLFCQTPNGKGYPLSNSSTLTLHLAEILSVSSKLRLELCHPKCARKDSGLSGNGPQVRKHLLYPRCLGSCARFSKDQKLFGRISSDIILFVS